jgi:CBS domain-containing protein
MSKQRLDDLISHEVVSVSPDTSIFETMQQMRDKRISCIIILENKKPVGIFTERDIVHFSIQYNSENIHDEIRTCMTAPVVTEKKDKPIFEAYRMMEARKIRHLVVVDDENQVVGVLTLTDILDQIYDKYCSEIQIVSKVMSATPLNISTQTPILQMLTEMKDHKVSCIVITDGKSRPVGIFTERDAVQLVLQENADLQQRANTVMRSPVKPVIMTSLLKDAVALMQENHFRRAVTVDDQGRLQGLVTQSDIVKDLERYYRKMMTMFKAFEK